MGGEDVMKIWFLFFVLFIDCGYGYNDGFDYGNESFYVFKKSKEPVLANDHSGIRHLVHLASHNVYSTHSFFH
jgi:hypothetical protein